MQGPLKSLIPGKAVINTNLAWGTFQGDRETVSDFRDPLENHSIIKLNPVFAIIIIKFSLFDSIVMTFIEVWNLIQSSHVEQSVDGKVWIEYLYEVPPSNELMIVPIKPFGSVNAFPFSNQV